MKFTETNIQRAIVMQAFKGALAIVPNCSWTGHECDLLIIDKTLRLIDIEIKISRADFKADAKKDKWFHAYDWKIDGPCHRSDRVRRPREWPSKVWKHYYAMPADIWDDSLLDTMASDRSGILLIRQDRDGNILSGIKKLCKPNRDAEPISAENAIDIARLAALRMWESYRKIDDLNKMIAEMKNKLQ